MAPAPTRILRPQTLPSPAKSSVSDRCIIAVGSDNPAKIEAAQQAFRRVWPVVEWSVVHTSMPMDFDSIPVGGGETQAQARTRASFALSRFPEAQYGVGIESGLFRANKCWFECTWAVIHDRNGTEGMASSAAIELDMQFAIRMQGGEALGNICHQLFGDEYTNDGDGYFGIMTSGGTNRIEVYIGGIMPALARFNHPEVFNNSAGS